LNLGYGHRILAIPAEFEPATTELKSVTCQPQR
jgi:hypothetical protein